MGLSKKNICPEPDEPQRGNRRSPVGSLSELGNGEEGALREDAFRKLLWMERRRADRSRKPFLLMLVALPWTKQKRLPALGDVERVLCDVIRESDLIGWYEHEAILGVIFTEIGSGDDGVIVNTLQSKILKTLRKNIDPSTVSELVLTFHQFPEKWDKERPSLGADIKQYPDIHEKISKKPVPRTVKRAIDIAGSISLLITLAPLLAVIAAAIKLTSQGPVIFKQERLGQFGKEFQCLKFRTMYVNNDASIHRDYVQNFIAGKAGVKDKQDSAGVYKITDDPRITRVGRILRKASLDELPQFWNVLRGDMSLVGPRPPLRYEFEIYDLWHRRRVLELKPGVTGLWQVSGRSRTSFDDMVRLDLRYLQQWSLWLDLKILLATPLAVFTGEGAF